MMRNIFNKRHWDEKHDTIRLNLVFFRSTCSSMVGWTKAQNNDVIQPKTAGIIFSMTALPSVSPHTLFPAHCTCPLSGGACPDAPMQISNPLTSTRWKMPSCAPGWSFAEFVDLLTTYIHTTLHVLKQCPISNVHFSSKKSD